MERDQLLAKLLLKLRKKKEDEYGDVLDSSFASSTGLESILTEADRIIRKDTIDSDSSLLEEEVVPKKKRNASGSFKHKGKKLLQHFTPRFGCLGVIFTRNANTMLKIVPKFQTFEQFAVFKILL